MEHSILKRMPNRGFIISDVRYAIIYCTKFILKRLNHEIRVLNFYLTCALLATHFLLSSCKYKQSFFVQFEPK